MLSEYLNSHPLENDLPEAPISLFPAAGDRAWQKIIPEHAQEIRTMAAFYASQPYPMRRATDFLAFVRAGSRKADEDPYFFRRRKLCAHTLACCLDSQADLDPVIDGIWCICEESSWVISAHNINPIPGAPAPWERPLPDVDEPYIDLFSAQTGMILSLVRQLLGEKLDAVSPLIGRRIEKEIRRRLLSPYALSNDFWWMGVRRQDLNNWTPWIVSNLLVCICAQPMARRERARMLGRGVWILEKWLACMPQDGGCDEGAGYWNMAGGALADCLEILEKATGRSLDCWKDEKLRNILSFPLKVEIGGGWFVNFADCDARPLLSGERLQWAGERMGDPALTAMGCRLRGTLSAQLDDVPHFTRLLDLLFHPAKKAAPKEKPQDVWLPDLQLRVVRRGEWTLCCKGGHNGENHNHNDVGSFMLYCRNEPQIVDAGNRVYTAQTFSSDRYSLWHVRSAYHNLPLLGQEEQQPGREFAAADVQYLPDGLSLDLAGCYRKEAGVKKLRRTLLLAGSGLTVEDDISLHQESPVTWVLMLRARPAFFPAGFTAGSLNAAYDSSLRAEAEEIAVSDARMARNFPGSLWRVTLTAPGGTSFRMKFSFWKKQ